jgi:hypothetical protein
MFLEFSVHIDKILKRFDFALTNILIFDKIDNILL